MGPRQGPWQLFGAKREGCRTFFAPCLFVSQLNIHECHRTSHTATRLPGGREVLSERQQTGRRVFCSVIRSFGEVSHTNSKNSALCMHASKWKLPTSRLILVGSTWFIPIEASILHALSDSASSRTIQRKEKQRNALKTSHACKNPDLWSWAAGLHYQWFSCNFHFYQASGCTIEHIHAYTSIKNLLLTAKLSQIEKAYSQKLQRRSENKNEHQSLLKNTSDMPRFIHCVK